MIDGQPIMRKPKYIDPMAEVAYASLRARRIEITDADILDTIEKEKQPARVRYRNEPLFHHLVDSLVGLLLEGKISSKGIRVAAELAIELAEAEEERRLRT